MDKPKSKKIETNKQTNRTASNGSMAVKFKSTNND
jgi:hypothetical protein